jgi:uncharacterized DUF497 family protein
MIIEFDPQKDLENLVKHEISLEEAKRFNWEIYVGWLDKRKDHGEDRHIAVGVLADTLYYVVYTIRGEDTHRVISLRKATKPERDRYVKEFR